MFSDPIKSEIWVCIRAMNDAWTKGNPDSLVDFFHPKMIAITPVQRDRLDGGLACVAGWKSFCTHSHIHYWQEFDPVIEVYGDSAVVAYYYEISFDMSGQTITTAGRDMFFLVNENGKWWVVADQFSAYPD